MKIWIGGKLGVRDWIDVVLAVNSLTIMGATLPLPDILAGGKLAEANQVGAAIALMIKLLAHTSVLPARSRRRLIQ